MVTLVSEVSSDKVYLRAREKRGSEGWVVVASMFESRGLEDGERNRGLPTRNFLAEGARRDIHRDCGERERERERERGTTSGQTSRRQRRWRATV